MLILVAIILLVFIPLVMLGLYLARPRVNAQGFLAVLAALSTWILVFVARPGTPQLIALLQWKPVSLFSLSPALLIDQNSWFFALALTSLAICVEVTSISQLGQSLATKSAPPINLNDQPGMEEEKILSDHPMTIPQALMKPVWSIWAAILVTTCLGLLAVTSGNLLTLILAWTALDLFELSVLLSQLIQSKLRERVIVAFSAKMAGTSLIVVSGILLWSNGASLTFSDLSPAVNTLLLISAGLRLGVLPLHLPFARALPINRNLGTILNLAPAAASYLLLFRISGIGVSVAAIPYLLVFSILAGVYAAITWLRAKNEVEARPYWLLATSSMVVSSAILQLPAACLAWSITSILSGGLILSMSARHKNLAPLVLIGLLTFSALPFTPTWRTSDLFHFSPSMGMPVTIFSFFSLLLLFIQVFLIAGFANFILRGVFLSEEHPLVQFERWVWFIYPVGLLFILATHWLIGWLIKSNIPEVSLSGWLLGPVVCIIAGLVLVLRLRYAQAPHPVLDQEIRSAWDRFFSLNWVYRSLWKSFHSLSRLSALISAILEGDGGLLWALVLFSLIFVFLQRR
jgi:hypothetical protein